MHNEGLAKEKDIEPRKIQPRLIDEGTQRCFRINLCGSLAGTIIRFR